MLAQRVEERRARIEPQLVTLAVDVEHARDRVRIALRRRVGHRRRGTEDRADEHGRGGGGGPDDERTPRWVGWGFVVRLGIRVAGRKSHRSSRYARSWARVRAA